MVVTLSVSKIPAFLSILYRLAFTDLCRIERGSEQRICSLGVLPGGVQGNPRKSKKLLRWSKGDSRNSKDVQRTYMKPSEVQWNPRQFNEGPRESNQIQETLKGARRNSKKSKGGPTKSKEALESPKKFETSEWGSNEFQENPINVKAFRWSSRKSKEVQRNSRKP